TAFGTARSLSSIAPLADGGFALAYHDFDRASGEFNAVVQIFDDHGGRVGSEFFVGEGLGDRRSPSGVVLPTGGIAVAWHESVAFSSGSIHSRLFHTQDTAEFLAGAPNEIPLALELNDRDVSETITRIEITGVPEGATIAGPAGTTATFDPGTGTWTLTGTL